MKVAVLGCGPAGLLAAYAVAQRDYHVSIFSQKQKSVIPGAVFLHEAIPGLTAPTPDGWVEFRKHGSREGYAQKVYGNGDADCSWDLFEEGERPAWSMHRTYDWLWDRFSAYVTDYKLSAFHVAQLLRANWFDLIISTIPAPFLCKTDNHDFRSQSIYVLDKTIDPTLENGMVYNGHPADDWYRTSRLFGSEATESTIPFTKECVAELGATQSRGYKPIDTDCDCFFAEVARIGRFGRWEKGILLHHAYKQTVQLLEDLA